MFLSLSLFPCVFALHVSCSLCSCICVFRLFFARIFVGIEICFSCRHDGNQSTAKYAKVKIFSLPYFGGDFRLLIFVGLWSSRLPPSFACRAAYTATQDARASVLLKYYYYYLLAVDASWNEFSPNAIYVCVCVQLRACDCVWHNGSGGGFRTHCVCDSVVAAAQLTSLKFIFYCSILSQMPLELSPPPPTTTTTKSPKFSSASLESHRLNVKVQPRNLNASFKF